MNSAAALMASYNTEGTGLVLAEATENDPENMYGSEFGQDLPSNRSVNSSFQL
jgi:hypothetical protein